MQRATWTDERLNDFSRHVNERFDHVDKRFNHVDRQFEKIDKQFDRVDKRLEQIDRRFERLEDVVVGVRTELRRDMGALQVDLKGDIAGIRNSIDGLHITLNRWLVGLLVCLIGVLAATALS